MTLSASSAPRHTWRRRHGEVSRARDTTLDRDVALAELPEALPVRSR